MPDLDERQVIRRGYKSEQLIVPSNAFMTATAGGLLVAPLAVCALAIIEPFVEPTNTIALSKRAGILFLPKLSRCFTACIFLSLLCDGHLLLWPTQRDDANPGAVLPPDQTGSFFHQLAAGTGATAVAGKTPIATGRFTSL